MREEIKRINQLVADGKLSPEDAADLIEAFYAGQAARAEAAEPTTPPPPPPVEPPKFEEEPPIDISIDEEKIKESVRGFVSSVERLIKEGKDSDTYRQAKDAAKKGVDTLRQGIEDLSQGKVTLGTILNGSAAQESRVELDLKPGQTLRVENCCGGVRVTGGHGTSSVVARAQFRASSPQEAKERAASFELAIEETDHLLLVRQSDVVGLQLDLEINVSENIPVEVRVEQGAVIIADTASSARVSSRLGEVALSGLNGVVEVNNDNGSVRISKTESPSLTVESKSGDVFLSEVSGTINARTASGDIAVESSHGKVISLESVSGDVRVDLDTPPTGNVNVRTVSGQATVLVCEGGDVRVSLSTLRGQVVSELPLIDEATTPQRVTGRLGDGKGSIDVSAVTGDVSLTRRPEVC
ncbi:hypothetical protein EON81_15545 [bacterium]|nr:MAG: hypothetical protein EON81_15545 [bacterium]